MVAAGAFVAVLALVVAPFALIAPEGLADSLGRQLGRPLQIESLGASFLLAAKQLGFYDPTVVSTHGSQNLAGPLPDALATAQTVVQGLALIAVWLLFLRGPRNGRPPDRGVRRLGGRLRRLRQGALAPVPHLARPARAARPRVAGDDRCWVLAAVAYVTTHLWFPSRYWDMVDLQPVGWLVLVRNLLLVALAVVLAVALATRRPEPAAPHSA